MDPIRRQDDNDWKDIPNGGFPNLYMLEAPLKQIDDSSKKKREFGPELRQMSIKSILAKKRHDTPYLPISLEE